MATFEFRKLFRADAVVKIEFSKTAEPEYKGMGYSKNMSQTGLNILTDKPVEKGAWLDLTVHIDDPAGPVKARGVIVWQKECPYEIKSGKKYYSMGVQIIEMSSEDAIRESDYVKDYLVKKSEEQDREIIAKLEELGET